MVGDSSLLHPESEQTEDELQEEIAKVSGAGRGCCGAGGYGACSPAAGE